MSFEEIKIEGLDAFQDYDLSATEDTPPGLIRVWFSVESVFMPFLSQEAGKRVDKNFIYLNWEKELGRSKGRQRLNDKVSFDEATGKYKVTSFSTNGDSHIKSWTKEWNAFYNNISVDEAGTPIELLFKSNPARAETFKVYGVKTIERLAGISEGDATLIGMGALDDKKRAMAFISKSNAGVSSAQFNLEVQELREQNASLQSIVKDLTDKLTILLQQQLEQNGEVVTAKGKNKSTAKTESVGV